MKPIKIKLQIKIKQLQTKHKINHKLIKINSKITIKLTKVNNKIRIKDNKISNKRISKMEVFITTLLQKKIKTSKIQLRQFIMKHKLK